MYFSCLHSTKLGLNTPIWPCLTWRIERSLLPKYQQDSCGFLMTVVGERGRSQKRVGSSFARGKVCSAGLSGIFSLSTAPNPRPQELAAASLGCKATRPFGLHLAACASPWSLNPAACASPWTLNQQPVLVLDL